MNDYHAHQNFDYDEIARLVDGRCEADHAPDGSFASRSFTHAELAETLAEFVRWIVLGAHRDGPGHGPNQSLTRLIRADLIGRRAISAAWILRPALFDGASLSEVGRLPGVDSTRKMLCDHVADFEDVFGIHSRAMRTQTNRDRLSAAATKRWQRERKTGERHANA